MIGIKDRGVMVVAVFWVQIFVCYVFTALRLYTRARIVRIVGLDDWLVVVSSLLFTIYAILITVCCLYGMGQHAATIPPSNFLPFARTHFFALLQIAITAAFTKAAVAVFLLRIVTTFWHRFFLYVCMGSMAFVSTLCVLAALLRCQPIQLAWDPYQRHACAFDVEPFVKLASAWTTVVDFALAAFPWVVLWGLHMRRKERLTIAVGLSLGAIGGVANIIRAAQVSSIFSSRDKTYDMLQLDLWSATEATFSIVCCTIPVLRPLYQQIRGKNNSSYRSGEYPSGGQELSIRVRRDFSVVEELEVGGSADGESERKILYGVGAVPVK